MSAQLFQWCYFQFSELVLHNIKQIYLKILQAFLNLLLQSSNLTQKTIDTHSS